MQFKYRDYQETAVEECVQFFLSKGKAKPHVYVAPVAAGKSLIIGGIAHRLEEPTLVLQPSKELLEQNYKKVISFGGTATIFSASVGIKEISELTYATLGSIKAIAKKFKDMGVKNVIIDECHMGYSPNPDSMFRKFMDELKPRRVLGFTATPIRLKPYGNMQEKWSQLNMITKGRPKYFGEILGIVPISLMVEQGYWSKLVYETYDFDEGKLQLNSTGAEFTEESMKKAIQDQGVNNTAYKRIKQALKEGRKNILVFCDSVHTAQKMAKLFPKIAACVHGGTKKSERTSIIERFVAGDIKIVTNFGTLTTGFDHPELDMVIFARPTNSLALFYQMAGRGTRIHPDKDNCLLVDFCNNVKRFGKLEDLNFEYMNDTFKWGMFSGDTLLSDCRMGDEYKVSKAELLAGLKAEDAYLKDPKVLYGKHKGQRPEQIPIHYLKWAVAEWDFRDKQGRALRHKMKEIIEKDGAAIL